MWAARLAGLNDSLGELGGWGVRMLEALAPPGSLCQPQDSAACTKSGPLYLPWAEVSLLHQVSHRCVESCFSAVGGSCAAKPLRSPQSSRLRVRPTAKRAEKATRAAWPGVAVGGWSCLTLSFPQSAMKLL